MGNNIQIEAINYISKNKLEGECLKLANKVGNVYMASLLIYKNIP